MKIGSRQGHAHRAYEPTKGAPSRQAKHKAIAVTRTGLSRSAFYERQNLKSPYLDSTSPSPVQIGQSAMGYREDELDAWIASRPPKER